MNKIIFIKNNKDGANLYFIVPNLGETIEYGIATKNWPGDNWLNGRHKIQNGIHMYRDDIGEIK